MTQKVKLAVFDDTLKAKVKKYPISSTGKQIEVSSGGGAHWMPYFDSASYLIMPKKFLFITYGKERIYFVKKHAANCINFQTEEVFGFDPQLVLDAAGSVMINRLGKDDKTVPSWVYIIILILLAIAGKVFGVIA